ncbi:MAG: NAD(P)H-dependent oxidoreductase subunit E [Deltaproteobacteria bacterium]|nr:NAD(P)H-dependent oxidoreductase subunit E [Deltaproteobacteria bacterium]
MSEIFSKVKNEIAAVLDKYPNGRSAVMDVLRIAQEANGGHLTKEALGEIAALLDMRPVEVNAAAAFYTMYRIQKPAGRHHIWVCRNISCSLLGAEHIIAYLERALRIKTGETTADDKFTLSTAECLGSCGTAPMMQIDDDYYENLTESKIDEILAEKGLK